jgi:hypothetical protein
MSVSPAASLVFVGNYLGRSRPWVQIAKATIASDYVRDAFFYRAVMAVPVHRSSPDINHRAPRGITTGSTRRACQARCHNGGHSNYQSREFGCDHREPFYAVPFSISSQHLSIPKTFRDRRFIGRTM